VAGTLIAPVRILSRAPAPVATRPHVLGLIDSLVGGGAERFAVDLMASLPADRFARTMCVSRMPADWRSAPPGSSLAAAVGRLEEAGVTVLPLHRPSRAAVWGWLPLLRELPRVDVLHAHMLGSNFWGSLLGGLAGVPAIVAHEQTWSFRGGAIRKTLDRAVIGRLADRIVTVSEQDRTRMAELEGVPRDKIVLIRNSVTARPPTGHDVRDELGIPRDAPVLVALAMLRRQKALDVLLQAVASARSRAPTLALVLAGGPVVDNPEADRLRSVTDDLGLGDAVHMVGRRDDVGDLLAAADIGVLSSDYEGTPLAVLEYMQAGLPVVATSVGGVPEFVTDGVEGLLVPPRDPAALADALTRLLDDPPRRAEMGRQGQERMTTEFGHERSVERFVALYDELLERRSGSAPLRREVLGRLA
jgi:glycosyltransferase involved in cell wall biosynthesis